MGELINLDEEIKKLQLQLEIVEDAANTLINVNSKLIAELKKKSYLDINSSASEATTSDEI